MLEVNVQLPAAWSRMMRSGVGSCWQLACLIAHFEMRFLGMLTCAGISAHPSCAYLLRTCAQAGEEWSAAANEGEAREAAELVMDKVRACARSHVCAQVHVCKCVHAHMCSCVRVCICVCKGARTCVWACACVNAPGFCVGLWGCSGCPLKVYVLFVQSDNSKAFCAEWWQ